MIVWLIIIAVLLVVIFILFSREWFRRKHENHLRALAKEAFDESTKRIDKIKNDIVAHEDQFRDILTTLDKSYDDIVAMETDPANKPTSDDK